MIGFASLPEEPLVSSLCNLAWSQMDSGTRPARINGEHANLVPPSLRAAMSCANAADDFNATAFTKRQPGRNRHISRHRIRNGAFELPMAFQNGRYRRRENQLARIN